MRSTRWLVAVTGSLALMTACGGDSGNGGGVEPNQPPVANFTAPTTCTATVACDFADASTDDNNNITAWEWNFGDNTPVATTQNASHVFAAAGTYNVQLKVTDGGGETNTKINAVTVAAAPPPQNQAPTASFSAPSCGVGVDCAFNSTSTDPDGQIVTTHWEFGDPTSPNNAADGEDVTHRFATAGTYNVTLTVTDNGGATGTTTQAVNVLPAPAANCTTISNRVLCTLDITARSTVKLTLTSKDCELAGNRVSVVEPFRQNAFENICQSSFPVPSEYTVMAVGGAAAAVFEAGSRVNVQFNQGSADPEDPVPGPPVARLEGTYPNWTMTVDDGGNPTGQNEPDFNDVIVSIQATSAP
jgi:PKD repeat protein